MLEQRKCTEALRVVGQVRVEGPAGWGEDALWPPTRRPGQAWLREPSWRTMAPSTLSRPSGQKQRWRARREVGWTHCHGLLPTVPLLHKDSAAGDFGLKTMWRISGQDCGMDRILFLSSGDEQWSNCSPCGSVA